MQVVFSPGAEIKFEGANNFRELGGYRAADGRQVKYGLLYRGGNLDLLKSEADHARLASLGLREILDLRSAGESAAHPDPAVPGAHYQRVCGMRNVDGTEMDFSGQGIERLRQEKEAFERSVGRPVHDFEWFSALYREMPFRNPAYHALFALLEGRRVPVLFHCSCGKDRTGIGAMLILLALGVSRTDALADYMLTNVYRREIIERFLADKPAAERELLLPVEGVSEPMGAGAIDAPPCSPSLRPSRLFCMRLRRAFISASRPSAPSFFMRFSSWMTFSASRRAFSTMRRPSSLALRSAVFCFSSISR